MIAWFAQVPLVVLTAAVFLALYLAVVLILVVLLVVRRRGHDATLGPLSPGLMAPLGLIFGLLVGFLVADVWADRARAASAVSQEASALRDIDLLAGAFPASQPQVRQLLREQIDNYVATEWPQMSAGQATLVVAPAQLVQAHSLVLSLPIATDGQRVAQNQLVETIDRATGGSARALGVEQLRHRRPPAHGVVPGRGDDPRRDGMRAGGPAAASGHRHGPPRHGDGHRVDAARRRGGALRGLLRDRP